MVSDWLGIDFGTCYSSAARLVDGRPATVKEPIRHGYSVPSSVLLDAAEGLVVGVLAESRKMLYPDRFKSEFKRELGRPEPVLLGHRHVPVEELVAAMMRFLRDEAEKAASHRLPRAVVTVPASYDEHLRGLMLRAAGDAGFEHVEVLEEPVAALIEHAQVAGEARSGTVLVYDLGGGTFDVALVETGADRYEVLDYDGVRDVGGANFDHCIERDLVERAGEVVLRSLEGQDSDDETQRLQAIRAELAAREECRRVKHELSGLQESSTSFLLPAGPVEYSLTRERLAGLVAPDLERTIECCEGLLERAGKRWDDLDGVLMVGGSCRLPFVVETVARASRRPIWRVEDPELAVCQGAARHAGRVSEPARSLLVDPHGEGDFASLPDAVAAAPAGGTVAVRPGTYAGAVRIEKPLTLAGEGFRAKIAVEGLVVASRDVRVSGVALLSERGPALLVESGAATVENCELSARSREAVRVAASASLALRGNRIGPRDGPGPEPSWGVVASGDVTLDHDEFVGTNGVAVVVQGASASLRSVRAHHCGGAAVYVSDGGGALVDDCEFEALGDSAVVASGVGSEARLQACRVGPCAGPGLFVREGAEAVVEESALAGVSAPAVAVTGASVRLHGNMLRGAVQLSLGAGGSVEGNTVEGAGIAVSECAPVIRGNTIRGAGGFGIDLTGDAVVADNVVEGSAFAGVRVGGGEPSVRGNRITRGHESGVLVEAGGGVVEDNEITANAFCGVRIVAPGTAPRVLGNRISQNGASGVEIAGASGLVAGNEIYGNGGCGLRFDGLPSQGLEVSGNRVGGNRLGPLGGMVIDGPLRANELGLLAMFQGPAKQVVELIEAGRIGQADELCVTAIRQAAGRPVIDSGDVAARLAPDMLAAMDAVWRTATGEPLRLRAWVANPMYGVTTVAKTGATHLQRRLMSLRL